MADYLWRTRSCTTSMAASFVSRQTSWPLTRLEHGKISMDIGRAILTCTKVSPNHNITRRLADTSADPIHVGSVEAVQGVTTLTMADDDNHARQRRALSHSFSQKALTEQEYIVRRYVDMLIENMHGMASKDEEFNLVCIHPSCYVQTMLTSQGQLAQLYNFRHHRRLSIRRAVWMPRPGQVPRMGLDDIRDCQSRRIRAGDSTLRICRVSDSDIAS